MTDGEAESDLSMILNCDLKRNKPAAVWAI